MAAAGGTASLGLYLIPTPHCAWCTTNNFDVSIGRALAANNLQGAAMTSHIVTLGTVPIISLIAAAFAAKSEQHFALHGLILLDSAMLTLALTQAVKVITKRQRPEIFFDFPYADGRITNQSFWSGHTSLAFSLLSTASVLAFRDGATWAPYFTALAFSAGLFVGYSRIASGKHWTSDVLAGMGLGIAVGTIMPFLILDSSNNLRLSINPLPGNEGLFVEVLARL